MRVRIRQAVVAAFASTVFAAVAAPPSGAAEYQVAQCATQDGSAVELTPGFVAGIRTAILNSCGATGAGFNLGDPSNVVSPDGRVWEQAGFEVVVPGALPNTKIKRFQGVLSLSAKTESEAGGGGGLSSYSAESVRWGDARYISPFAEPAAPSFPWDRSDPVGSRRLSVVLECGKPCQFTSRPAFTLHRATITLDDPAAPADAVVEPGGLFAAGIQRGTRTARLSLSDADSGIRTVELRTESGTLVTRAVDGSDCTFTRPVPCPQRREQLDVAVDTTVLPDGGNVLEAWVTDAAGNLRKTRLPLFIVGNRPEPPIPTPVPEALAPLNGSGGDPLTGGFVAASTPKRITTSFGRAFTVPGKLVDAAGRPLAGSAVDVIERIALPGAPSKVATTIVTDAAGAFTYTGKGASSRSVTFGFAQRLGGPTYAAKLEVDLRVKAVVSLRASRAAARRGVAVRYTGRVQVADLPKRGVRVVLEASTGGGWKIAAIRRTDQAGDFSWSHAFSNAAKYRIRARVLVGADTPAQPGTSKALALRIR